MSLIMTSEMIANMAKDLGISLDLMRMKLKSYAPKISQPDRSTYIGSSDCAGISGVSKWVTPYEVYLRKTSDGQVDDVVDDAKAKVMARGTRMEPYVLAMMQEEMGIKITAYGKRYTDQDHPFLMAEIDAEFIDDNGDTQNIEIKTSSQYAAKSWDEGIPMHYVAQAMHGLMVTGRKCAFFGVLIGSDDFRVLRLERDDDLIAAIRKKEIDFWFDHVQKRIPPSPTVSDDLAKIFAKASPSSVEADMDTAQKVNDLKSIKAQMEGLEEQKKALEAEIKLAMGDNSVLSAGGDILATWKSQKGTRLDTTRIKQEAPEIYNQFLKTTESRVFLVK